MLISNRDSTWSEFATYYDNSDGSKPVMPIDWKIEDIVESYKNNHTFDIPENPNFI